MKPCIYMFTCNTTGEKYVGSTHYPSRRRKAHLSGLRRGKHRSYKFQNAYDQHGEDSFQYTVLEYVEDVGVLLKREQFWIDTLKPELNVAQFAEHPGLGIVHDQGSRDKMRQSRNATLAALTPAEKEQVREKNKAGIAAYWASLTEEEKVEARKRRSHPQLSDAERSLREQRRADKQAEREAAKAKRDAKKAAWEDGREEREIERRRNISVALTGKSMTDETKEKLRQVAMAQQADPDYRARHSAGLSAVMGTPEMRQRLSDAHKGKALSQEHRDKLSASHKGQAMPEETKAKISESQRARHAAETEERKRKTSDSLKKAWAKRKAQSTE